MASGQANLRAGCFVIARFQQGHRLIDAPHAGLGFHCRMRVDYAGDTANGAWQYVIIGK